MFAFSFGNGLQMQTLLVAVQNAAPAKDMGVATGTINLARLIGASLGLAVNGGLLQAGLTIERSALDPDIAAQVPDDLSPAVIAKLPPEIASRVVEMFATAFDLIYFFGALLFVVGLVLALMIKDVRIQSNETRKPRAIAKPAAVSEPGE